LSIRHLVFSRTRLPKNPGTRPCGFASSIEFDTEWEILQMVSIDQGAEAAREQQAHSAMTGLIA
jgi:hypothetical protein